jgi:peptidoglycan hydrolase CwlO-like protein
VRGNLRRAVSDSSERRTIGEAPIITDKSGGIGKRLILLLLVLAGIGLALGQAAWAEPPAITKAKSEAEALQERVDELAAQLDAAVEDYNYARAKLADTKQKAGETQRLLTEAEQDLEVATGILTERLVRIYKEGQLGLLDSVVGSSSFSELVNRLDMMKRLSEQDAQLVEDVSAYEEEVSARKAELAQQLEDEKTLTADAKTAKTKVEERLAANEKALAGKEAQIAQLQKEEAARQAKLAAEAKKRADAAKK